MQARVDALEEQLRTRSEIISHRPQLLLESIHAGLHVLKGLAGQDLTAVTWQSDTTVMGWQART
uniref:Uncharacterized protein n=1 Tax=Pristionchus pacificus TaxID=54126 RepID=A0A2A6C6B7_PRIPA|eukprot:PDM73657.1 hypothetical protein PRIPAC_41013 [Pristionchus pacificus]